MAAHKLPGNLTHPVSHIRMMEQVPDSKGATFGRVDKKPRVIVPQLEHDTSRGSTDHGFSLPHGLCNRQSKALADGLLHDHVCRSLKGIYFMIALRGEEQKLNVGVPVSCFLGFRKNARAFRIVGRLASGQYELARRLTPHYAKCLDYSQRVFKGIKSRDLQNDRFIPFNAQPVHYGGDLFLTE